MTAKLLEPTVGDIMTAPVVAIEMSQTVTDALTAMEKARVRKVLVLQEGVPRGLLEDWMASKMDPSKTLKAAFEELGVNPAPIKVVGAETPLDAVQGFFGDYAALVVLDVAGPANVAGIVTATDLYKAKPRFEA